MESKKFDIPLTGKHPDTEEAILVHLYERPEEEHSTESLSSVLTYVPVTPTDKVVEGILAVRDGLPAPEFDNTPRPRTVEDVQRDIEALIVKGLVKGKRKGTPGKITHANVQLTTEGERQAIEAKNRDRKLTIHMDFVKPVAG
jgi:hypothetical protein